MDFFKQNNCLGWVITPLKEIRTSSAHLGMRAFQSGQGGCQYLWVVRLYAVCYNTIIKRTDATTYYQCSLPVQSITALCNVEMLPTTFTVIFTVTLTFILILNSTLKLTFTFALIWPFLLNFQSIGPLGRCFL